MGTPFENFVNLELPRRPALLTLEITAYDGDPNDVGAPAILQGSPKGTFYLQDTGGVLWQRKTATSTSWVVIGSGISSDTASNLGTGTDGEGLFSAKVSGDFQFKRIKAGSGVTLTPSTNYVQIDATGGGGGEANTASNLGATVGREGLFTTKSGVDLPFKSLVPGANITMTSTATEITINSTGGVSPVVGHITVADVAVQTTGAISNKVWVDPPTNSILASCTSSTADVSVTVRASYPKVIVGGVSATLPLVSGYYYYGPVNVTVAGTGPINVSLDTPNGATSSTTLTYDSPPVLTSLTFTGSYPGSQTELKAGDVIGITGTTDKASTGIEVVDFGAGISQFINFASNTTFTTTITVANRGTTLQALAARVRAKNAAGAFGATRDTNQGGGTTDLVNLVNLNNLYPTVSFGSITYPATQGALKNSETASVVVTTANLDSIAFDSPNSQVSITNPTTIASPKTVTRIAGSYNISTNNLRAVATRDANASQTTAQTVVYIANTAASLMAATPAARLRSGGNNGTSVQNHTITLTSDQQLAAAPALSEQSGGGTFTGSWAGGPLVYTRTLQVSDNDAKNTYSWQSLSATNLSGLTTTTLTSGGSYVLGGFVPRSLTFAAFSQTTTLNVAVTTYSKLVAGIFTATNQAATRMTTQGDHANSLNQFTVDSLGTSTTTLFWNDQAAASSNSSGTAQITLVEETV